MSSLSVNIFGTNSKPLCAPLQKGCLSDNPQYASILKFKEGELSYVAKGVRNSVGFDFHPITKKLFFTDNGRDWLGDDSPSCELNKVEEAGQFFGFPYKHASNVSDPKFGNQ